MRTSPSRRDGRCVRVIESRRVRGTNMNAIGRLLASLMVPRVSRRGGRSPRAPTLADRKGSSGRAASSLRSSRPRSKVGS